MKFKLLVVAVLVASLSGCGAMDRWFSSVTGGASKVCIDGVSYLQFTSGATVQYGADSKVVTCK